MGSNPASTQCFCPQRVDTALARARIPAGTAWTYAMESDFKTTGKR
jgi:hypothetical protein